MMRKWAVCFAVMGLAASAMATTVAEPLSEQQFGGHYFVDAATGAMLDSAPASRFVGDVYQNTLAPSAANLAFSSTNLSTIYGDSMTTIDVGTVDQFSFTVFNSATSNTLPITTMQVAIQFSRADTSVIGGFTGNVNFGAGLSPGFFSVVTFTNLATLATPIVLDTTAILVDQQRLSHTGGSVRMGIASMMPINVGSSPDTYRVNGVATSSASGPVNPGYRIGVIPEPASLALLGLGSLALIRRR